MVSWQRECRRQTCRPGYLPGHPAVVSVRQATCRYIRQLSRPLLAQQESIGRGRAPANGAGRLRPPGNLPDTLRPKPVSQAGCRLKDDQVILATCRHARLMQATRQRASYLARQESAPSPAAPAVTRQLVTGRRQTHLSHSTELTAGRSCKLPITVIYSVSVAAEAPETPFCRGISVARWLEPVALSLHDCRDAGCCKGRLASGNIKETAARAAPRKRLGIL